MITKKTYLQIAVGFVVLSALGWTLFFVNMAIINHVNFPKRYDRIAEGMTVQEVELLLGPGAPVVREDVPRDLDDPAEPVVDGETLLLWARGKQRIVVAFTKGRVVDHHYWVMP
jgi:hypothetical protein